MTQANRRIDKSAPSCMLSHADSDTSRSGHPKCLPRQSWRLWRSNKTTRICVRLMLVVLVGLIGSFPLWASSTGSISGTVTDSSGAAIPAASITVRNVDTGVVQTVKSNGVGSYSFPALPYGHYSVIVSAPGFKAYQVTGVTINANSLIRVDAKLQPGMVSTQVTVNATAAEVNTQNAQMGGVIGGKEMLDMPLASRSFTDLFALQPGVVPVNSGEYGDSSVAPGIQSSTAGQISMSGARENMNGFTVNGANVNQGTAGGIEIVPNIDSLQQFRILTNNTSAQYGNYAGGLVNVVTKSGTNKFHGDAFEFVRNTILNARPWFSGPTRQSYHRNMFGGTFGGPIIRNKLFFFGDYQGTRQVTPGYPSITNVPSAQELTGNLSDLAAKGAFGTACTGMTKAQCVVPNTVTGAGWANELTNRFGYQVKAGEPYYYRAGDRIPGGSGTYSTNCTSSANCVFPNGIIAKKGWDPTTQYYLNYVKSNTTYNGLPAYIPVNDKNPTNDDMGGIRLDYTGRRVGTISAYYYHDANESADALGNGTFPGTKTQPGFSTTGYALSHLLVLSDTKTFGSSTVNLFTASATRFVIGSGIPQGGSLGVSAQSIGFAPASAGGFDNSAAVAGKWSGVPAVWYYGTYMMNYGAVGAAGAQLNANNTYQVQDDFSKLIGKHSLKFGVDYHIDHLNQSVFSSVNGDMGYASWGDTGEELSSAMIGSMISFTQNTLNEVYGRTYYLGLYAQDNWRVSPDLTLGYGLRWELMPFWAEKYNHNPVLIAGEQSQMLPTAPKGYLFPGDPGIPHHFAPISKKNFAPRFSLAYAPGESGPLGKLFGPRGTTSIRAGFGLYYTAIEGDSTLDVSGAPPYGLSIWEGGTFDGYKPYVEAATQSFMGQPFPVPVPPKNVSPSNPDSNINWQQYGPINSEVVFPMTNDRVPYVESYDLSVERKLGNNTVASVSYVGSQGHRLFQLVDINPGDPAQCLALSQPGDVMPGTRTCGPNNESRVFYPITGGQVDGTRPAFRSAGLIGGEPAIGGNGAFETLGNSKYNALEAEVRHTTGRLYLDVGYTWSKSMDQGSGFTAQLNPYNHNLTEGLSSFDMTHYVYTNFSYELPINMLFRGRGIPQLTRGWKIAGNTRMSTGLPITMSEIDDRSLQGNCSLGAGGCGDVPNYAPGNVLAGDHNPRDEKPYFNINLFSKDKLGQEGNSRPRFFHGPGMDVWNLSAIKDVKLREEMTLELRAEFLNAFNHASFYATSSAGNINSGGSMGLITGVRGGRIVQIASKLYF